ncbi:MAG: hypothetical protein ABS965_02380, partial [Succiniclasticum sp.]
GKTGVINAGRMVGLVPDSTYFNRLLWNGDSDLASYYLSDLSKFGQRDDKGNFVKMADRWNVNNNNEASIDIAGQINARSGIVLGASNIVIQNGALLQSRKDLDFTKLVNAKKADGSVITSAGLTNTGMTMEPATDKSGDIILRTESVHTYDFITGVPLAEEVRLFVDTANNAAVEVSGAVKSDGGVDISSNAANIIDNTTWAGIKPTDVSKELLNALGFNIDGDWAVKYNTASVGVKKTGSIEAGGNVKLQSDASLNIKLKNATLGKKPDNTSSAIPVVSMAIAKMNNKALVDVQGDLSSGGDMSLAANANTKVNLSATAKIPYKENQNDKGNAIYVGTAWITGDSLAAVTVGDGNKISAKGAFSADARVTSDMNAATMVVGTDKTFALTSFAVVDYDSAANVDIGRSVEAASVAVNADNTVSGMSLDAGGYNGEGEEMYVEYNITGKTNANQIAGLIKDKLKWDSVQNGGGGIFNKLEDAFAKAQEYVTAGASVAVLSNSNTANITVAPGVELKATGEAFKKDSKGNIIKDKSGNPVSDGFVSLTANTRVGSLHHSVAGEANEQDEETQSKVTVAAAVLYSRMDNDASIDLQSDPKTHKGATLTSQKGNVNLKANATQIYDPLEPMKNVVDRLGSLVKTLKTLGKEFPELFNLHTESVKVYEKLKDGTIDESTAGTSLADLGYSVGQFLVQNYKNLIKLDQGVQGLVQDLSNVLSPASYTNYYVRSYTVDSQDTGSNLDLAASVNIARLRNRGFVSLGEKTAVTAGKNISIDATTDTNVVSFTGNAGEYLALSESNGNGVGASLAVQDFTGDSMILSGKDVSLKAETGKSGEDSGKVSLKTKNDMIQTGVILSAGKSDSHVGVSGSVNVLTGGSNSLVLLDDESVVKAANSVVLSADNKTSVTNIVGGLALGSSKTNLAMGAGVAINDLDVNTVAAIGDNGLETDGSSSEAGQIANQKVTDTDKEEFKKKSTEEQNKIKAANTLARGRKLAAERGSVKKMGAGFTLSDKNLTASLGAKTTSGAAKGSVTGGNISVTASSGGAINAVALEGASNSENHSAFDTFDKWSSLAASGKNQTTIAAKNMIATPLTLTNKLFDAKSW